MIEVSAGWAYGVSVEDFTGSGTPHLIPFVLVPLIGKDQ